MTPLLAQTIAAVVVLITLIVLLLMGYWLWLQCLDVAEQDRQREAQRQRLAAHRAGRFPPSWTPRLADGPASRISGAFSPHRIRREADRRGG